MHHWGCDGSYPVKKPSGLLQALAVSWRWEQGTVLGGGLSSLLSTASPNHSTGEDELLAEAAEEGFHQGIREMEQGFLQSFAVGLWCVYPKASHPLLCMLMYALLFSVPDIMQKGIFTEIEGSTYLQNNHFRLHLKYSPFLLTMIFCLVLHEVFLNKLLQLALQSLQPHGQAGPLLLFDCTTTALSKRLLQALGTPISQHMFSFKPVSFTAATCIWSMR